jgi:hypothetical protein
MGDDIVINRIHTQHGGKRMTTNDTALPAPNIPMLTGLYEWAEKADGLVWRDATLEGIPAWKQGDWARIRRNGVCETAFCIAGHAVSQSNYLFVVVKEEGWDQTYDLDADEQRVDLWVTGVSHCIKRDALPRIGLDDTAVKHGVYIEIPQGMLDGNLALYGGPIMEIENAAREVLGLTRREAGRLFSGGNTLWDLRYYMAKIAEARGIDKFVPGPEEDGDLY